MGTEITRRHGVAGFLAICLFPGALHAERGPAGAEGWLGWDDLGATLGRDLRIAGFLRPLPAHGQGRRTKLLVPCLPATGLGTGQRLTLIESQPRAGWAKDGILVVEATGRIERLGNGYGMAAAHLRTVWRMEAG